MFTTSPGEYSSIPVQIAGGTSSALAVIATNAVETITKTIRTAANLALHRGELTFAVLVPAVKLDSPLFVRRHFPPSFLRGGHSRISANLGLAPRGMIPQSRR